MKLYETLLTQLKKEPNYVSDNGEVKKWVVADKARNYDANLLALLLENNDLRQVFFKEIHNTTIFLLDKFLLFIEQKNYLNDSYTAYRNKIGLTIGGQFLNQRHEVELVWPYKDCVLEGGQTREDQKRPEIFFNQTLAQDEITQLLDPKVLTAYKRYGKFEDNEFFHRDAALNEKRGLPKDTITDNLVIKGNNLLALHTLKKEFAGKVKLIYIDPPYNTGNDSFGYNDSFNHSTWLTFMKNRLEVAKDLLKDDGAIFVQCDDNEQAYLKIVLDEVFKNENYISSIVVKSSTPSGLKTTHKAQTIIKTKDYIHFYKKKSISIEPQYIRRNTWDSHFAFILNKKSNTVDSLVSRLIKEQILPDGATIKDINISDKRFMNFYKELIDEIFQTQPIMPEEHKLKSKKLGNKVYKYSTASGYDYAINGRRLAFLSDSINNLEDGNKDLGLLLCDLWSDIDFQNTQNEGGVSLPNGKKPEKLLFRIFNLLTKQNDIVLDYHLGSGTTAAVAHKMNRQYIGIEQLDYENNDSVVRLQNVINGDKSGISRLVEWNPQKPTLEDSAKGRYDRNNFIYLELKKYNQSFIERIEAAKDNMELLQIWEKMKEKSFLAYNIDIKTQNANIEEFKQLGIDQQKQLLCELLDKNQLYVNVSDMDDTHFVTTEEERKVTKTFYSK